MKVKINSIKQHDCTVGVLNYGDFRCFTLELPDLENKQNVSCIPHGTYECVKYHSNTHGQCIAIKNVIGRTNVRIHSGNFTRQILGCVLVGESLIDIDDDGVIDVSNSRRTLKKLLNVLPDNFQLEINRC